MTDVDIAEFLTARYDAIENALTHLPKRARELPWELYQQGASAQGGSRGRSVPWAVRVVRDEHAWTVADHLDRSIAEYLMVVGDPAGVLADIAAKRRHIAMWWEVCAELRARLALINAAEGDDALKRTNIDYFETLGKQSVVQDLLWLDAEVYADHPDYAEAKRFGFSTLTKEERDG